MYQVHKYQHVYLIILIYQYLILVEIIYKHFQKILKMLKVLLSLIFHQISMLFYKKEKLNHFKFRFYFRIEQIPNHVFVSLFELVHLNISDNKIGKIIFVLKYFSIFYFRYITTTNASINIITSINIK